MTWWKDAVGQIAEIHRAFTREDVQAYRDLTGDPAPHDQVPEPLIAGMFSKLLGVDLPGPGTNYLKQDMQFLAPARPGEMLHAIVEVTRVRPSKSLVDLATTCRGADGTLLCRGRALVLAPGR